MVRIRAISRISSWAQPKRVSVAAVHSETMGITRAKRAFLLQRLHSPGVGAEGAADRKSNGLVFQEKPSFPRYAPQFVERVVDGVFDGGPGGDGGHLSPAGRAQITVRPNRLAASGLRRRAYWPDPAPGSPASGRPAPASPRTRAGTVFYHQVIAAQPAKPAGRSAQS